MTTQPPPPTSTSLSITLQTPFLYQNRTGAPSAAPLTARQLCRILCPASSLATAAAAVAPQTLVLGFDAAANSYDGGGWKSAASLPVLKEACAGWYYECDGVRGPVSARTLAELVRAKKIDFGARVFGGGLAEWRSISDLTHLQLAMEALTESEMPTSWPDGTADEQIANMTYSEEGGDRSIDRDETNQKQIASELEAFLSSTDHLARHAARNDDESDQEYESDGGTRYVKDFRTGNWIHEALAPPPPKKRTAEPTATKPAKKRKRPKFAAKNAKCWIYVTDLPLDTNESEVASHFSKCGVIDLDPETQKPKVKLYRHKSKEEEGRTLKGDASICYARPESVELALQILDEGLFRDDVVLRVQRAKFQESKDHEKSGKRAVSEAKRKVARLAALQAVGWDEGENGRIAGGLKGLRIVVLMRMFDPAEFVDDDDDEKLGELEERVHAECEEIGAVEKITIFSKHPAGVVIVKFAQPNAASDAVNKFNGRIRGNFKVEASYWDGVTDYTVRDEEKEAKDAERRLDEFGDWLENQELPDSEEFRLRVGEEGD